jgi:hypothetical protein
MPLPPPPPYILQVDLVYLDSVAEVLAPRGVPRKDIFVAMEAAFGELEALRRWGRRGAGKQQRGEGG